MLYCKAPCSHKSHYWLSFKLWCQNRIWSIFQIAPCNCISCSKACAYVVSVFRKGLKKWRGIIYYRGWSNTLVTERFWFLILEDGLILDSAASSERVECISALSEEMQIKMQLMSFIKHYILEDDRVQLCTATRECFIFFIIEHISVLNTPKFWKGWFWLLQTRCTMGAEVPRNKT